MILTHSAIISLLWEVKSSVKKKIIKRVCQSLDYYCRLHQHTFANPTHAQIRVSGASVETGAAATRGDEDSTLYSKKG